MAEPEGSKKKTRSSGPGHLSNRGPKKWFVQVYRGKDRNGKPRYTNRTVHGTKAEANKVRLQLLNDYGTNTGVPVSNKTVGQVLFQWLDVRSPEWRPSTQVQQRGFVEKHLAPLHPTPIHKLRPLDIEVLYGKLGKRLSQSSVRRVHATLHSALAWAVGHDFIPRNPATGVAPKVRQKTVRPPSASKVQAYLDYVENEDPLLALCFRLLAATGARRGEVVGLKWSDINARTSQITFRRVVALGPDGPEVVQGLKGGKGVKKVTVDQRTAETLAEMRSGRGYVFSDDGGETPWRPDRVSKAHRRMRAQSGIGVGKLHNLRHFHATQLLARGIPIQQVSERLGHQTVTVTLNTYAHAMPALDKDAANAIGDVLDA